MERPDLAPDMAELLRIADRVRIELVYTRSALRQFLPIRMEVPTPEREEILNNVAAIMSRCNDAIKEVENLLPKIK